MNIFLDLDGTLLNIRKKHYAVYKKCVDYFEGKPLIGGEYWRNKRNGEDIGIIIKKSQINKRHKTGFIKKFTLLIEDPVSLSLDSLFPNVKDILINLKRKHLLYLVTLRKNKESLIYQLKQLDIYKYFNAISVEIPLYENFLEKKRIIKTMVKNPTGVVVGDTQLDIQTGKSLGLKSIAVTTGMRSSKLLKEQNPDKIISSINYLEKEIEVLGAQMMGA